MGNHEALFAKGIISYQYPQLNITRTSITKCKKIIRKHQILGVVRNSLEN